VQKHPTSSLQVTLQREGFADKTFTFDHAFGPSVPNTPRVEKNTGVWHGGNFLVGISKGWNFCCWKLYTNLQVALNMSIANFI